MKTDIDNFCTHCFPALCAGYMQVFALSFDLLNHHIVCVLCDWPEGIGFGFRPFYLTHSYHI